MPDARQPAPRTTPATAPGGGIIRPEVRARVHRLQPPLATCPMPHFPLPHEWVGFIAAILTTVSFVPQAALTLRTRSAEGVSLPMYTLFTAGVALWLVYGVLTRAWPVIVANAVTLALASLILVTAWRSRRRPGADAPSSQPPS
jgi:MtN3 and saliva related transmembrane protein